MRLVLPILLAALTGCATVGSADEPPFVTRFGGVREARTAPISASAAAQTGVGQTARRGLPLTRGQKVLLWTGVAVFLGYVMVDSDDDDPSVFAAP